MHLDKHTTKIMIKLVIAMLGAVAIWLVFSKLKDDSRALETVCIDGFWDEWSRWASNRGYAGYAVAIPSMII